MIRLAKAASRESADSEAFKETQEQTRITEVDLQYCLHFPFTKEYEKLFHDGKRNDGQRKPRPPMWNIVEQCMKDGTLDDLRSGALDTYLVEKGIRLRPRQPIELSSQTAGEENQPRIIDYFKPEVSRIEKAPDLLEHASGNHADIVPVEVPQYQRPLPNETLEQRDLESAIPGLSKTELPRQPEPKLENHLYNDSDESEGGVVLNLTTDHESGEISEIESGVEDEHDDEQDDSRDERQEYPVDIRGGGDNDPDDAMLDYSNADQPTNSKHAELSFEHLRVQSHQPSTLAELGEGDLQDQVKYFFVGQDIRNLDFTTIPVRCLVCSQGGHMAATCPKLTCADCGNYNDHFPPFCPRSRKCAKCRAPGHVLGQCKSKLKVPNSELECDLCSNSGHTEEDCELIWRTSGAPSPISLADERLKYVCCYECGGRSHLGNDCPTRRPGKPMGASTWSLLSKPSRPNQLFIRSKGEMTIKGRAQRQQPISINSTSDDENDGFVRPKISAPTKPHQIRIQAPKFQEHGDWNPPSSRFAQNPGYPGSRPGDRLPAQQHPTNYNYDSRAYNHQPSLPAGPPPSRGDGYSRQYEPYRPMPSSGQQAWRQYRS